MRAEAERAQSVQDTLREWLTAKTWRPMDDVDRYLISVRLVGAMRVLLLLSSAPVHAEAGPYDLVSWLLFVDWDKVGREA